MLDSIRTTGKRAAYAFQGSSNHVQNRGHDLNSFKSWREREGGEGAVVCCGELWNDAQSPPPLILTVATHGATHAFKVDKTR